MSKITAGGAGKTGAWVAGGAVAVVLVLAAWVALRPVAPLPDTPMAALQPQEGEPPAPEPDAATLQTPATTPDTTPETTASAPEKPDADEAAVPSADAVASVPPAFDEVRREADGLIVIAGRAVPGATITVLYDGQSVATAIADAGGKFAALAFVAPDGKGHVLTLSQSLGDVTLASDDEIILAPLAAPVQTAEAVPPADPTPPTAENSVEQAVAEAVEKFVEQAEAKVQDDANAPPQAGLPAQADDSGGNTASNVPAATATPSDAATAQSSPPSGSVAPIAADAPTEKAESVAAAEPATDDATPPVAPVTGAIGETKLAVETPATGAEQDTPETGAEQDTSLTSVEQTATANAEQIATASSGQKAIATPATPATTSLGPSAAPQTPEAPSTDVALLKSTREGVELLNPPKLDVMSSVALDTISYSDTGEVQLAGRAQADTKVVRIYLDNYAVISLPVSDDGTWRGDVPNVDEGLYTLRVDEVSGDGAVTSRVETPFKREAPAVLAAAAAQQNGPVKSVTVQKGNTLWAIARDRYGEGLLYVRVFEANKGNIRDPDLIYPGQVFDLPE